MQTSMQLHSSKLSRSKRSRRTRARLNFIANQFHYTWLGRSINECPDGWLTAGLTGRLTVWLAFFCCWSCFQLCYTEEFLPRHRLCICFSAVLCIAYYYFNFFVFWFRLHSSWEMHYNASMIFQNFFTSIKLNKISFVRWGLFLLFLFFSYLLCFPFVFSCWLVVCFYFWLFWCLECGDVKSVLVQYLC